MTHSPQLSLDKISPAPRLAMTPTTGIEQKRVSLKTEQAFVFVLCHCGQATISSHSQIYHILNCQSSQFSQNAKMKKLAVTLEDFCICTGVTLQRKEHMTQIQNTNFCTLMKDSKVHLWRKLHSSRGSARSHVSRDHYIATYANYKCPQAYTVACWLAERSTFSHLHSSYNCYLMHCPDAKLLNSVPCFHHYVTRTGKCQYSLPTKSSHHGSPSTSGKK